MEFIDDRDQFIGFCQSLSSEKVLALDTEFMREHSYEPVLALVQTATEDGRIGLIDYVAIGRMKPDPLAPLLNDSGIVKVFHAAYGDLEVLQPLDGRTPGPIWDTQLAAGLFGYSGRTGYSAMVETFLKVKTGGSETLTDWTRRPLSDDQLRYAAEDVRYLIPLYRVEQERLRKLGRLQWAEEECEHFRAEVDSSIATRSELSTLFRAVRGSQSLSGRELSVLRELCLWREGEARRRNRPRSTVMRDDLLVQIARRAPSDPRRLGDLRGIQPREVERFGPEIVAAIQKGKHVPQADWPEASVAGPQLNDDESALVSVLSAVLQSAARRNSVLPSLVATTDDLRRLVWSWLHGSRESQPVLSGWRGELVGKDLIGVLEGKSRLRWDVERQSITVE